MTSITPQSRRVPGRARRLLALAAAAALLAQPALAVPRCSNETDQAVFEVEALKTELMVVATTCKGNTEDRYNDFVRRYQQALVVSNREIGQYFTKLHGRGGQRAQDIFITELANARSNNARRLGSDFCPRNSGLFDEVMALQGVTDLPAYAATKDLLASGVTACPGGTPAAASARATKAPARRSAR
ncbi:hypothetical protein [Paracraurococcus lichenis]|uniref:Uncharacterized protein n=1 Tax=Paracraurococcus lichenis TaxID=3064888 RepID=A0ABT9DV36_9PROT|nr:hypothetical protein [Paracraurococcus sp. LOR1-02]MDO9707764.1 hypothetical protein [Paracraurococcus sp. LOR1-02]